MVHTVQAIAAKVAAGTLAVDAIDEAVVSEHLLTKYDDDAPLYPMYSGSSTGH